MYKKIRILSILIIMFLVIPIIINLFQKEVYAGNETLTSNQMQEQIKNTIEQLKIRYPKLNNYNFIVQDTGLEWKDVIAGESKHWGAGTSWNTVSVVQKGDKLHDRDWICTECYNAGRTYCGGGWLCASDAAVAYMVDPRNSLNYSETTNSNKITYSSDMFQFMLLSYYKNNEEKALGDKDYTKYSREVLINKFSGTWFDFDGKLAEYVDIIIKTCESNDVNPYYIVAKMLQEQGVGKNPGSTFKMFDGGSQTYYYNIFNFNANGKDRDILLQNALSYAKDKNWNSVEASLIGGIELIGNNYISIGQNTLYYERFNVVVNGTVNGRTYSYFSHQYANDVMYAQNNGTKMMSMLADAGAMELPYTFVIPIYNNMPATASPRPVSTSQLKVSNDIEINTTNKAVTTIPGKNVSEIINALGGGTVIRDSGGNVIVGGSLIVGTGYKIDDYTIVVKGDVNGDGNVDIIDMALIKRHINGTQILTDIYMTAGLINKQDNITIIDMALMKRHINNTQKIEL